ncbi:hypothetical protein EJ05DRAFT_475731 [Pseudovirgaria hyperparasitica]|uniref:Homeobox domain-containing protein n=1 Tax=Pseudovirgaria hyperparasitica TaxID=470096 RepID=A0A6A6W789_9PEZI|nr:uncharacterized protein EJ05DRAFT_475731 [Pseudovirgaria hyperparasitica]KAF2758415.1 hypothetical protein EJ05DRAFT_475731 [Pseudovirgaria hyperparasitica]
MDTVHSQRANLEELFDFSAASMPEDMDGVIGAMGMDGMEEACSLHPGEECICNDLDNVSVTPEGLEEEKEFDNDFSSWLPRYSKPPVPCDYCGPRKLDCFFTCYSDNAPQSCTSCSALFRPCSFAKPEESVRPHNAIDTLHVVGEDDCVTSGDLTGYKPLRSKYLGRLNRGSTPTNDEPDRGRKTGTRFSRPALKILKEWMEEHRSNPYPSEEEKAILAKRTSLSMNQVNNWLANTRRREKNKMPKRATSPSIRPSTEAVDVPEGRTWYDLNPFERWKHSPPENEPAPMPIILDNIRQFSPPTGSSSASSYRQKSSTSGSHYSALRAPSTTSLETGSKLSASALSSQSFESFDSARWSHGSRRSWGSFGSFGNPNKDRRRRRRATAKLQMPATIQSRIYQCTFCTDRFKSKYDWSRHEKSLHLSLEKWICAPLGHTITNMAGEKRCAYCDYLNPTPDHIESHNHQTCAEKGIEARTFYRKDHLRQHLKLMHACKMTDGMESWKSEAALVNCRCGFCGQTFTRWQDRVDHIAKEFKNGAAMKDWKGCRGLDPHIASLVTNAMPPYLIDNESKSPIPFSASNTASIAQHTPMLHTPDLEALIPSYAQPPPPTTSLPPTTSTTTTTPPSPTTSWEHLTIALSNYTHHYTNHTPTPPSDATLQRHARLILYDCDDPWNQTAADNPAWLALFKQAHALVPVPPSFDRRDALEDLGVLGLSPLARYGAAQGPRDVALWKAESVALREGVGFLSSGEAYCSRRMDMDGGLGAGFAASAATASNTTALGLQADSGVMYPALGNMQTPSSSSSAAALFPAGEHEAFSLDEDLFADFTFEGGFDVGVGAESGIGGGMDMSNMADMAEFGGLF